MDMNKKSMKSSKGLLLIFIMVLSIIVIGSYIFYNSGLKAVDEKSKITIKFNIEAGTSTDAIGKQLKAKKLIKSDIVFKVFSKLNDFSSQYKAGNYIFSPSMDLNEIASMLIEGREDYNTFTIPEGYTILQTAVDLEDLGLVTKDKFLNAISKTNWKYKFLKDSPKTKNQLEGFLFPNTYQISKTATEVDIINVMLSTFNDVFKEEYYNRVEELGLTIEEVITIASIIERECKLDEERPKVASVIYNRLKDSMPLQMCSTVQYVLGKQKDVLTNADTEIDSPYNTYQISGLPPTPICSPGEASIKAALYPEDTDYIYFVVSEKLNGSHNFSKDYNKFLNDSKAYYDAVESN